MTALQVSIGALNDLVDAPRDAVGQPWKPIPSGRVSPIAAAGLAGAGALLGLGLAVGTGPLVGALGMAILAVGYAYDLRFKGTPWSWLPFAVGIPLLPVFAWVGATGTVPSVFLVLVPAACVAGGGLALANSLVDLDADRAGGVGSPAQAWGRDRTLDLARFALAAVVGAALVLGAGLGAQPVSLLGVAIGGALVAVGARWLAAVGRQARERGWEAAAVGIAVVGASWLGGLAAAGRLG